MFQLELRHLAASPKPDHHFRGFPIFVIIIVFIITYINFDHLINDKYIQYNKWNIQWMSKDVIKHAVRKTNYRFALTFRFL
jgi:uncharacterized membrane protein